MTSPRRRWHHPASSQTDDAIGSLLAPEIRPNPDPSTVTVQAIDRAFANIETLLDVRFAAVDIRFQALDRATIVFQENLTRVPTETQKAVGELASRFGERFSTVEQTFATLRAERLALQAEVVAIKEAMHNSVRITEQRHAEIPDLVSTAIDRLQSLHSEKFDSVDKQFRERDTRSERESRDNKVAVDAAFAAQKEAASEQNKSNTLAIDKSEQATKETLNKQADLFNGTTAALAQSIANSAGALGDNIQDLKERMTRAEALATAAKEASSLAASSAAYAQSALVNSTQHVQSTAQVDHGQQQQLVISVIGWLLAVGLGLAAFLKP